jgi:Domain of unknown function (DU1801)
MAELKTKKNEASVEAFINTVPDEQKRKDAFAILEMMKQATKMEPKMWGSSIIGFGEVHYKYESGHEGDMCMIGFSPRKQNFALYLMTGLAPYVEEFKKLGKYKTGKGCLYINKLSDIDSSVLKNMMKKAVQLTKSKK